MLIPRLLSTLLPTLLSTLCLNLLFSIALCGAEETSSNEKVGVQTGVDFLQQDPTMNTKYQRGRWLVYDCVDQHWVCTRKEEFEYCQKLRKKALLDKEKVLPCAYFKKFDKRELCWQEQLRLTNRANYYRFCEKF